jgi:DNA polymerase II large subunit
MIKVTKILDEVAFPNTDFEIPERNWQRIKITDMQKK